MKLALLMFAVAAALAPAADEPIDLTGAGTNTFRSHLGRVVSLRGRLEEGKERFYLVGATPTNVLFYVIPKVKRMALNDLYERPPEWTRLLHKQVRITGELGFHSFDRASLGQAPPNHYYMLLRRTSIERVESK